MNEGVFGEGVFVVVYCGIWFFKEEVFRVVVVVLDYEG